MRLANAQIFYLISHHNKFKTMANITITINTGFFLVSVTDAFSTKYVGHRNDLFNLPDNAIQYSEEDAEDVQMLVAEMYPDCKVAIEEVTETMDEQEFTEQVANIFNTRSAGWDYQHCGGVREEHIAEYIATLENTLFCGADIRKSVPELMSYVEEPGTIEEHAVTISGVFGSRFTACPYGSVYLFITLKK